LKYMIIVHYKCEILTLHMLVGSGSKNPLA